jgi:hypothetical protein
MTNEEKVQNALLTMTDGELIKFAFYCARLNWEHMVEMQEYFTMKPTKKVALAAAELANQIKGYCRCNPEDIESRHTLMRSYCAYVGAFYAISAAYKKKKVLDAAMQVSFLQAHTNFVMTRTDDYTEQVKLCNS